MHKAPCPQWSQRTVTGQEPECQNLPQAKRLLSTGTGAESSPLITSYHKTAKRPSPKATLWKPPHQTSMVSLTHPSSPDPQAEETDLSSGLCFMARRPCNKAFSLLKCWTASPCSVTKSASRNQRFNCRMALSLCRQLLLRAPVLFVLECVGFFSPHTHNVSLG